MDAGGVTGVTRKIRSLPPGACMSTMSLRFRINILITAIMLVFTLAVSALIVDSVRRQAREEVEAATKIMVQLLTTVIYSSQFTSATQDQVQILHNFLKGLGPVRASEVRLFNAFGDVIYVSPPVSDKISRSVPKWFATLVGERPGVVTLRIKGGILVIVPHAYRAIVDAWDELRKLLGIAALFFVAMNLLIFWLIGRLLKPVPTILEGLSRMRDGHFDARLPALALPELSAISHTFNRMAEALERTTAESERLALVVRQASDAIFIVDDAGQITLWNPAAERLFGHKADAVLGTPVIRLAPPGKEEEIRAHLAATQRREIIDHVETQRLAQDGRIIDVSLSAAPLIDPRSGALVGQVCSLRDITEKKKAEEAARELRWNRQLTQVIQKRVEEEQRTLARELHDEFSQCVTGIKTIGMTIANRVSEREPETRSQAMTIVSVADQLYDMVHGMIRKLRTSTPHRLGLARALEEAVSNWQGRHEDIKFNLKLAGVLDTVPEETSTAVYRIVQESLTNVVRHAGATRVDIEVTRNDDVNAGEGKTSLHVAVSDNGRGIVEANERSEDGFGLLGMRERVEALNGILRIENRPDEGVQVTAAIPLGVK
jgi:hypothetical protein